MLLSYHGLVWVIAENDFFIWGEAKTNGTREHIWEIE
jgi:hypothetical protein